MRRVYLQEQGLPSGCIFYAPLAQGDLTDHVSGVTGTPVGNCGYTWDSNENAYLFNNLNGGASNGALKFVLPNYMNSISTTGELTMLAEVKGIQNLSTYPQWTGNTNGTIGDYTCIQIDASEGGTQSLNVWYKFALMYSDKNDNRKFYKNGVLTYDKSWATSFSTKSKSDLWILPTLRATGSTWGHGKAYVRNVWRFDRALTQAEIKQIQNIP